MIKSVTITNWLNEAVKITLSEGDPEHGMVISEIEGLGPPKANVNMSDLSGMDGSVFNSAKVERRNILVHMLFTFAPTIEDARHRTYRYFPIKKELEFLIETDNRILKTTGIVESNEPDIFSDNESNAISILCGDPYFYSNDVSLSIIFGIEPLFEFEFSNESLDESLIEFGSYYDGDERNVYYNGDAETGVTITIHALGEFGDIIIYNTRTKEFMKILVNVIQDLTGSGIMNGDDIIITTMRGNKRVGLLRAGRYTNILNALDKESDWFQLSKGNNMFAYETSFGSENVQLYIQNQTLYEGV